MATGATFADINRRNRARKRRDPEFRLEGADTVNEYASGDTIPIADYPSGIRTWPITVGLSVVRDDAASNGILFEIGSNLRGFAAWINADGDLGICAGDDTGDDGLDAEFAAVLPNVGQLYRVVVALVPIWGMARAWVDGRLIGRAQSVTVPLGAAYGAGSGAIARAEGTVTPRIPVAQRVTLADATVIGNAKVYTSTFPQTGDW